MRARLALDIAQISVQLREVVLRDKPEEFLAASPSATVPTLVFGDGTVIDESIDIMRWVLALSDPQNWLLPAELQAEADELIELADGDFKHHLDHYKYANRYDEGEGLIHRQQASQFLTELDQRLQQTANLMGERITLADIAIAPFVRQFANVDRSWFDNQSWAALVEWLNNFCQSDAFNRIMDKYPQWNPGDDKTVFPSPI